MNSKSLMHRVGRRARLVTLLTTLSAAGLAVTACATGAGASTRSRPHAGGTVNLVAYSTPALAYSALITAFKKTAAGKGVTVNESFGASGQQATAVLNGQPADVVNFSTWTDMDKLQSAKLVPSNWQANPEKGYVTNSVVAIVVRPHNPLHIHGWNDLVKKNVKLITPNPFSSGSARWNLLAGYGAELKLGDKPKGGDSYLNKLLHRAITQPQSASDAMTAFTSGEGNVLLDYESDAIAAKRKGAKIDIIIPKQDILIQNPIAVLAKSEKNRAAKAFYNFLLSTKGQEIWAKQGYRPVIKSAAVKAGVKFVTPKQLFTMKLLGGWPHATNEFFGKNGVITKIEASLGISTSG